MGTAELADDLGICTKLAMVLVLLRKVELHDLDGAPENPSDSESGPLGQLAGPWTVSWAAAEAFVADDDGDLHQVALPLQVEPRGSCALSKRSIRLDWESI